jgi:arylsulfatase
MLENDFINTKNTSFEIVADIETSGQPANRVIVFQGGRFGGWSLYVKDGTPAYMYSYVGIDRYTGTATENLWDLPRSGRLNSQFSLPMNQPASVSTV